MSDILLLSFSAAINPTLFAAVMVMLLSTNAKRLMLGYLLGAYLTSITVGLVILLALPESSGVSTARNSLSPAMDLALGLIALLIALVLGLGPPKRIRERREKRKLAAEKKTPRWRRALNEGSPRVTFAVGAVLSLPGASYLVALDILHKQDLSRGANVISVIAFNLIMLLLIELPLLGYVFAPDWTVKAVESFQEWLSRDARRIATRAALVIGVLLVVRGAIEFLS
jgi:Sap, sulfolipid-1-addressing protein